MVDSAGSVTEGAGRTASRPASSMMLRLPGVRRRLAWLITARVVISILLLGAAVALQVRDPGTLPADPFFLLIALTFALTVVYAVTRA